MKETSENKVSVKYLSVNKQDERWGLTVSTVGHQLIKPNDPYPSKNHPFLYLFDTDKGRVLHEYQLIYIIDGKGTFESEHHGRIQIFGGQMILLFPGEWHSYRPEKSIGWYEHWIGFNGEAIDHLVKQGFFTPKSPIFDVGMSEEITQLYHLAANCALTQNTGFQQLLAGVVQLLLGYTYSQNKQAYFENAKIVSQITKAKQLISEHYHTNLPIQTIANEVGLSYPQFRSFFKQYTGFSPIAYIEDLRILKSKELLANTTLRSQEIAYEVGFNTPYYFSIFFKQKTGHTPMEYRKISRNE